MENINNGNEWLRVGDKFYKAESMTDALECYINAVRSDDISINDKVSALIKISSIYLNEQDINSAFKYGALATVCTDSPRSDSCCLMSELYYTSDNIKWAIFWAERAMDIPLNINDLSIIDDANYTWIPMSLLSKYYYNLGDYEKANEYIDGVLKLVPNNEDAKENKKTIEKMLFTN